MITLGQFGTMSEKDFDACFAAWDDDGSGGIDFVEYTSFMEKCRDEKA